MRSSSRRTWNRAAIRASWQSPSMRFASRRINDAKAAPLRDHLRLLHCAGVPGALSAAFSRDDERRRQLDNRLLSLPLGLLVDSSRAHDARLERLRDELRPFPGDDQPRLRDTDALLVSAL